MKIEKAHQTLDKYFEIAHKSELVKDKVAWSLHKTWEQAEIERRKREEKKQNELG